MSALQSRLTANTLIKTYPEPSQLSMSEPHVQNVFAKPSKHKNEYGLKFTCRETGLQRYWGSLMNQFIYDVQIHDYIMQNHQLLGVAFKKYWQQQTKCVIPKSEDCVYDTEDRCLFLVASIENLAETAYIHPFHRERLIEIKANKIEIKDSLCGDDMIVSSKTYYLNANYIEIIGNLDDEKINDKMSQKELFGIGDNRLHRILSKKLLSVPKPTKTAKAGRVSDDFDSKHWINYLSLHLASKQIITNTNNGVVRFKLRTNKFESTFPFVQISNEDQHRLAYLDYFQFKVSVRTGRLSLTYVFLIKDKISGIIEGEDLIPDDF